MALRVEVGTEADDYVRSLQSIKTNEKQKHNIA